jgi:hypothetical protein
VVWEIAIIMHADDFGAQRGHEEDAISQAAARWLARRDRGWSEAEKAGLERWKAADPRHASELARMELTWREYDWAKSAPELLAMVDEASRMSGAGSHRPVRPWVCVCSCRPSDPARPCAARPGEHGSAARGSCHHRRGRRV